jgi:HD superfamily phosphodiesterase
MIPTEIQAKKLWDIYQVPESKRRHLALVAEVANFIASRMREGGSGKQINIPLLTAAALLHDLDKNVHKLADERHPDAAVRILKKEGMTETANLVASHPLHLILDPATAPRTWEEKILFLSDKMVKYEIITVDERFKLWNAEHMPEAQRRILDGSYPKVKALETEIFSLINIVPGTVKNMLSGK